MKNIVKKPLVVVFVFILVAISVLNMKNFTTIFKEKMQDVKLITFQSTLNSFEAEYTDTFVDKENYVDINGLFARLVGKKELNERYRLKNGYLATLNGSSNMNYAVTNLTNTKEYLDLYDIPYAYIQVPYVFPTDDDPMLYGGYETYINRNLDRLLVGLDNNEVNYLNLREMVVTDNLNTYDLYFSTDSHWTTETAFWAHKYIVKFVNSTLDNFTLNEEYFDIENYNIDVMACNILGSHGQRTGLFFAGTDKVSYIYPNFDTNFNFSIPSRKVEKEGSFQETMSNTQKYSTKSIQGSPESIYLLYNSNYKKITNFNATNNLKILLLNDSFSLNLAPFLSLHFKEVHMYDIRDTYGGSPEEFIEKLHEIQPDMVLQIRDTNNFIPE